MQPQASTAKASPWILSPAQDLGLFIATPLLILPLTLVILQGVESKEIQYVVLAFGAMGHNLPGMMRAYGDAALFRRFRTRFILAPIVFAALAFGLTWVHSSTILILAVLWSIWHAFMQVYGFARIYDAKVGAFARWDAHLDLMMCMGWFGAAILFSDSRVHYLQSTLVDFGMHPLSAASLQQLRTATGIGLGLITTGYLIRQGVRFRAGASLSMKNLLYASAIGFYWYANVTTTDVLLGLVMFEVFHDVQYLAIVWVFNRRRAETDSNAGGFTRFLFRRSWGMLALYVGLVLAYGGLLPVGQSLAASNSMAASVAAFVTTSALLHYYFDGFIWKVREESTRQSLGIADNAGAKESFVTWHGIKWAALLLPVLLLYLVEDRDAAQSESVLAALVASTPKVAAAHEALGNAAFSRQDTSLAIEAFEQAVQLDPTNPRQRERLDVSLLAAAKKAIRASRMHEAQDLLRRVSGDAKETASALCAGATESMQRNDNLDAMVLYRASLLLHPDLAESHLNLALLYRKLKRLEPALAHAREGFRLRPQDDNARRLVEELTRALAQPR